MCGSASRSHDDDRQRDGEQQDQQISAWVGDDTGPGGQETVLNGSGR
jgi:hypothetical protein